MSRIDRMIGYLESVIATGMDSAIIMDPPAMLKWLKELKGLRKELKRLRKEVKHCKTDTGRSSTSSRSRGC